MSQRLNNPQASSSRRNYGATGASSSGGGSQDSNGVPDVSVFSPTEFMSLSTNIGRNIRSVLSNNNRLQRHLAELHGPPKKSRKSRIESVHDINTRTNDLIRSITHDLRNLAAVVQQVDRGEKKKQQLQLERLKGEFNNAVELYSATHKDILQRIKKLMAEESLMAEEEEEQQRQAAEDDNTNMQIMADSEQQQLITAMQRHERLAQLEKDMVDINSMMHTFNTEVLHQGEAITSIEDYVGNAAEDVERGREELAKAAQQSNSYRRKILILLLIAVIVGLIVTGIIVSKIHK